MRARTEARLPPSHSPPPQFTRGRTIGIKPHLNDTVRVYNAINVSYSIVVIAVLITQIIFVWRSRYFVADGAVCRTVRLNRSNRATTKPEHEREGSAIV